MSIEFPGASYARVRKPSGRLRAASAFVQQPVAQFINLLLEMPCLVQLI